MEIQISKKQFEDIGSFYDLLSSEAGVVEGFFIKSEKDKKTRFYADRNTFIQDVVVANQSGYTCYAGLQPRDKKFLGSKNAADSSDVVALKFLYLDLDPLRPKGVNATDQEKTACLKIAREIHGEITNGLGYREPILTDSGNGCWLLMRIPEISITDKNRREIQARLKTWGKAAVSKFTRDGAEIDHKIFDLRRITKIPGTKIFNYPDNSERPRRVAEILSSEFGDPDKKLRDDFLSLEIELKSDYTPPAVGGFQQPLNPDRIFERCYLLSYLKEQGDAGVNIPHDIRLALSTFSLSLGDLQNELSFIRRIIGGCPDFSEDKTRYYLEQNKGKSSPYGCEALRNLLVENFKDFDTAQCACNLPPIFDPIASKYRVPSPIRFAYLVEDDLEDLFTELALTGDKFRNLQIIKEFTRSCLTGFDVKTADAFLKSKKKEASLINEDIKNLLEYRKTAIALEKAKEQEIKISSAEKEKVVEILKRPSLLYDYGAIVQRLGVVGEDHNIRIILLSLTSSKLPGKRVVSLIIKAESSSGKSYVLEKCLEVYPNEQYYEFTSLSDRALIYTDQDFKHKFIIFYEYSGIEDTEVNKLIRTLQSENRLRYAVTIKVDGDFEVRHILKEGPTGCITTTTQPQLFDENETRVFSLYMDETEEQTKQICRDISGRFTLDRKLVSDEELQAWANIQRVLEPYHVHIPFAGWLAENIPTDKVRIRRDFERIMAFISASALLHQYQRETREKDGRKYVIASVADYLMARELLEATLVKTVKGTSPKTETLVELIKEICAEKMETISSEDNETDHCASMSELVTKTGKTRQTIYNWLRPAINGGVIEVISGGGRGKPTFYRPTDQAVKGVVRLDALFLPQPEQIINAHPDLAKGLRYVDPITGDEIIVEEKESPNEKNGCASI
jgi:hypothetical protein